MPKTIAYSTLNASTIDILNVIRENASPEYQQMVPKVEQASDIPAVGKVIYGTPAIANQFINALVNRIASVRIQSATFNNPYRNLKKGYLEFGETIENIFVGIASAYEYNPEKGEEREFKRTMPDVKSVFHVMNWQVVYPITIQDNDLYQAFMSLDGVTDLIAKIVDQVYTGAEYDEFLLFKYLLVKGISHGKFYPESIGDGTDLKQAAVAFRGASNLLPFMSSKFNESHVKTTTPKDRQAIFMDANFNAQFDVNVLASAFNMDKADFMGRLYLIDDWTSFDNDRFETIRKNSDGIEEVTSAELNLLKDVKAVIVDTDWFQCYDNLEKFTEKYVASSLYWNYFYHVRKTISYSPFANAIVFCTSGATTDLPATVTAEVIGNESAEQATVLTLNATVDGATLEPNTAQFVQTEALTQAGIGMLPYGVLLIPATQSATEVALEVSINGTLYQNTETKINASTPKGTSVVLTKVEAA